MLIIKSISHHKIAAAGTISDGEYVGNFPRVGEKYLVVSRTDTSPNAVRGGYDFDELCIRNDENSLTMGAPGNSNPNIRQFHGWRGTTNDICVTAHGVRRCLSVKKSPEIHPSNGDSAYHRYWVRFGADLTKNED